MTRTGIAVLALMLGSWLVSPLAQAASYHIQLKNGREFITTRVWEEGGELRFSLPAGTVGVPREAVHAITEVGVPAPSQARGAPAASQPTAPVVSPPATSRGPESSAEARTRPEGDALTSYRAKKAVLMEALDGARTQHLDAITAKDQAAKQRSLEAMRGFGKQIDELAEEVKAKNQGKLPGWWQDEVVR
jgi:hypothetical protein